MSRKNIWAGLVLTAGLAALVTGLLGCSAYEEVARHTFVTGRLVDVGTGVGVAGARVLVGDDGDVTDANGDFVVRARRGWQRVLVTIDGYSFPDDPMNLDLDGTRLDLGDIGLIPTDGLPPPYPVL